MQEIWKDIEGYDGRYQISTFGRIKRLEYEYVDNYGSGRYRKLPEKFISANIAKMGYYMVDLRFNGVRKRHYVHRLVAQAFIPNPNNLPCINHKDEDKTNNHVDNLEWCTYGYNINYGTGRARSVITRRKNGTYENISDVARKHISDALLGKKKSAIHRQHISDGRKKMFEQLKRGKDK